MNKKVFLGICILLILSGLTMAQDEQDVIFRENDLKTRMLDERAYAIDELIYEAEDLRYDINSGQATAQQQARFNEIIQILQYDNGAFKSSVANLEAFRSLDKNYMYIGNDFDQRFQALGGRVATTPAAPGQPPVAPVTTAPPPGIWQTTKTYSTNFLGNRNNQMILGAIFIVIFLLYWRRRIQERAGGAPGRGWFAAGGRLRAFGEWLRHPGNWFRRRHAGEEEIRGNPFVRGADPGERRGAEEFQQGMHGVNERVRGVMNEAAQFFARLQQFCQANPGLEDEVRRWFRLIDEGRNVDQVINLFLNGRNFDELGEIGRLIIEAIRMYDILSNRARQAMAAENEGVEGAAEAFNGGEPRDQNAPGVMIKEFEGAINKEEAAAVQEKLREVQEAAAEAVATVEEPAPEPAAPAEEPAPETPAEAAREEKVAEAEVKKITEITDVDELQQEIQKREQELNSIKTKEGQVDLPEIIEQYSKIAGPIKKFIGKAKEFKKTVLKVTRTEVTLDDRIKKFKDMLTSSSNPRELEDVIKEINKRKNMSTDEKRYCVLEIELTYLRNRLALSKAEKEAVKEKNELDAKLEDIGKRINDIENFYKGKKPLNVKKLKKFAEKFVKRAEKGKELAEINRDIEKIGTIKYKATNVALCLGIPSEIYPTIKEYCKLKAEFASLNIGT